MTARKRASSGGRETVNLPKWFAATILGGAGSFILFVGTAGWWASGIEHRLERDEIDTAKALTKLDELHEIKADLRVVRAIVEDQAKE